MGCPVPQAAAGMPRVRGLDDAGLFAERENPKERVRPLSTEFTEMPHGRTEQILELGKPLVDGRQWLEQGKVHLPLREYRCCHGPLNPCGGRIEVPGTTLAGLDQIAKMPTALLHNRVHWTASTGRACAAASF